MPSKKKPASRTAQLAPQVTPQSDYDTDTANVTVATQHLAPPPARTNTELNLMVLQRYVPDIERIIAIAPFAVVYIFSPETQQWEKSGTEGTLFVCQLSPPSPGGHTRYNVMILNRKSLENFVTELTGAEDVEITEQYVILQVVGSDGTPNIYGLWIFSDEVGQGVHTTRELVAGAIMECAIRAEKGRKAEYENGHDQEDYYDVDDAAVPFEDENIPVSDSGRAVGQLPDLLSLLNKPQAPTQPNAPATVDQTGWQQATTRSAQFATTPDTDFFHSRPNFNTVRQHQHPQIQPQPQPQQSALLDLFKSAQ